MIGGRNDNHVTRQAIDLQQQRTHNALDFAGFMPITPFLPKRVELVEEQYAAAGPHIVEGFSQPGRRFPKVAGDQTVVADTDQGHHQGVGKRFREQVFPFPGGPASRTR